MANVKMGFEGQIFYGTAGSTGATQILNFRDANYNLDVEKGQHDGQGRRHGDPDRNRVGHHREVQHRLRNDQ